MSLNVRVIAPDGITWEGSAESVTIPTPGGEMGILPGHASLTTSIDTGVMTIRNGSHPIAICLMGGFAQIEGDEILLLSHGSQLGEQIDPATAQADLEAAQNQLERASNSSERSRARATIRQAQARLKAAGGMATT
ncbi:ATP synthase F1 subunit epsilon [Geitlerinema sp. PCC 9228]|jgi:F-type H+-transporting ATPase subunit epsilon|uniref:ATP synthase F1 subunit epsilon n=1 Tax=Geitlerinema sp. PCC 9228 TaxID=111611 RepID=UPI0008F9B0F9|nr:ATP synthase F1 subunit epsilon [Geitlerinema sp. PCC 9228]